MHGKCYHKNHLGYVFYNKIFATALLASVTAFPALVQLKYSLNTFCSPPETSHLLNRLATSISYHKLGVTTRFLKLLIFSESFYGARYIFFFQLPSK